MSLRVIALVAVFGAVCLAADTSAQLLAASARGHTEQVKALLSRTPSLEATDKDGRTPLMLAAQHGHADTVKLLLARGANPDARDSSGLTAYGVALLDPAGRGDHEDVLKMLPRPPRARIALEARWTPAKLVSSCFMDRAPMAREVGQIHLDAMVLEEVARFAFTPAARNLAEIVHADKLGAGEPSSATPADANATVILEVEPGAACSGQTGDNLTLSINVRVFRGSDHNLLLEKAFGGGLKGLRMQTVNNPSQYAPVYGAWIKPQAAPIFWAVMTSLMKVPL
jgi:hypothetical protein